MDPTAIDFVLKLMVVFSVVVVAALICATILGVSAFRKTEKGAGRTFSELFRRAGLLQLMTVVVIVISVLILTTLGKADQGAFTVLSGIAGYVLGGLPRSGSGVKDGKDEARKDAG